MFPLFPCLEVRTGSKGPWQLIPLYHQGLLSAWPNQLRDIVPLIFPSISCDIKNDLTLQILVNYPMESSCHVRESFHHTYILLRYGELQDSELHTTASCYICVFHNGIDKRKLYLQKKLKKISTSSHLGILNHISLQKHKSVCGLYLNIKSWRRNHHAK